MTKAIVFEDGVTITQALDMIVATSDDVVHGAIMGMVGMLTLLPSYGLNISTVVGVAVEGILMDGYMFSVTQTSKEAEQPYDQVCKTALLQRFIAVDPTGRAVLFVPVDKAVGSKYLN